MAGFSINTITVDGVALIARAAATSQLIYTRVLSATAAMTEQTAGTAQVGDFDGAEGNILSASASDDRAIIRGVIYNQPSEITLKTFAICAKIDGDASDVVLAVQSDPDAEVIVPADTAPAVGVEVDFLITIADAENVTVESIGPGTVSFGDLDRFVSMYKAGDPTSGEAQTIHGAKTFSDSAHFASGLTASGGLFPDAADNTYQIGDGNTPWYGAAFSGTVKTLSLYAQYILPDDDSGGTVGRDGHAFRAGYFDNVYTTSIWGAEYVYPSMMAEHSYLGTEIYPFYEVNATMVNASAAVITGLSTEGIAVTNGGGILCSGSVTASSFEGVLPYPELDTDTGWVDVPVGGLVGVFAPMSMSDVAGKTFSISSQTYKTATVSSDGIASGSSWVPAGTYIGVAGGNTGSASGAFALLMRIA